MHFQGLFRGVFLFFCCVVAGAVSSTAALKVELLSGGFSRPVFVCSPPGDANRLFVLNQHTGQIRIYDRAAGMIKATPFLTITALNRGSEEGLLGMAFHPGYATNGYFFLNITPSGTPRRTEIVRYQAQGDPATAETANAGSRKLILTYNQPFSNHNGGWLGFGLDGYLYIASGDGGDANDPQNNAQNRANLLGKILRIDVDLEEGATTPYEIPEGNPFRGHLTFRNEIWAFGLRNPWRCSIDRETGNLWIGDVGQGAREEIDVMLNGVGGANFGWRPREGTIQTPARAGEVPVTPATNPIFEYGRTFGFSVTGGYVYRGSAIPELRGKYIFADFGSARFWATTLNGTGTNGTTVEITPDINPEPKQVNNISSFGEDAAGELYVCDLDGQVFRILGEGPLAPRITAAERAGNDLVMRFEAAAGQGYRVEGSSVLGTGANWSELAQVASSGTNRTVSITNAVTGEAGFFRIRSE